METAFEENENKDSLKFNGESIKEINLIINEYNNKIKNV
jgi:hypothetical protein